MGYLSEGERPPFAIGELIESCQPATLERSPHRTLCTLSRDDSLVFLCLLSALNPTWRIFSFTKCQLGLKRRGRGEVWQWALFPFWRLLWVCSAQLFGRQLRCRRVCREGEGKETVKPEAETQSTSKSPEKIKICVWELLEIAGFSHCSPGWKLLE